MTIHNQWIQHIPVSLAQAQQASCKSPIPWGGTYAASPVLLMAHRYQPDMTLWNSQIQQCLGNYLMMAVRLQAKDLYMRSLNHK